MTLNTQGRIQKDPALFYTKPFWERFEIRARYQVMSRKARRTTLPVVVIGN